LYFENNNSIQYNTTEYLYCTLTKQVNDRTLKALVSIELPEAVNLRFSVINSSIFVYSIQ